MSGRASEAQLAALAAGLCLDAGIGVERHPTMWAWDPTRRVLLVSEQDLAKRGPDFCAGVIAHEIGHAWITRYHLFEVPFASPRSLGHLLNCLEDPRVNTWIRARYPGARAWLASAHAQTHRGDMSAGMPRFAQFCWGSVLDEAHAWAWVPRANVDPAVASALLATRAARRRYAETLPPTRLDRHGRPGERRRLAERYRAGVWPALRESVPRTLPAPSEQLVRVEAAEALRGIQPVIDLAGRLLKDDRSRLEDYLGADKGRAKRAREALAADDEATIGALVAASVIEGAGGAPGESQDPSLRDLADRLLDAAVSGALPKRRLRRGLLRAGELTIVPGRRPGEMRPGDDGVILPLPRRGPSSAPPPHERRPLALDPSQLPPYERLYARVADQVDHLARSIEDVLVPRKRLREVGRQPSGHRIDLRGLMNFEADPRRYDEIWVRKTVPERREATVSLLVDLSGSMEGGKTDAAIAGTMLLAETLHRLQIPFAINGFQDRLIRVIAFYEGLDDQARSALAALRLEVSGTRPGGNNQPGYNDDGPCLLAAAGELSDQPEVDRLLIVVSDGEPAGVRSGPGDLRAAIRRLSEPGADITLIGVGLGPDTAHVEAYYPNAVANVPVEGFSDALGELLRDVLTA